MRNYSHNRINCKVLQHTLHYISLILHYKNFALNKGEYHYFHFYSSLLLEKPNCTHIFQFQYCFLTKCKLNIYCHFNFSNKKIRKDNNSIFHRFFQSIILLLHLTWQIHYKEKSLNLILVTRYYCKISKIL